MMAQSLRRCSRTEISRSAGLVGGFVEGLGDVVPGFFDEGGGEELGVGGGC
jgi:hypothetical protein